MSELLVALVEIIPINWAESLSGLLVAVGIVALVLDTLRNYAKRAALRIAAAYGFQDGVIPSEPLARAIMREALPVVFHERWVILVTAGTWLWVSIALLTLGSTMFGFASALGVRLFLWVLGHLSARILDRFVNSPPFGKTAGVASLHGWEGASEN